MKKIWLSFYLLIGILLTGCTSDDSSAVKQNLILDVSIDRTRITKNSFTEGDNIGIYLVDYLNESPGILGEASSSRLTNGEYIFSGSFWYPHNNMQVFLDETFTDLYAYYPYDEEMSHTPEKEDLTAYPFSLQPDQRISSEENDFLWSKIPQLSGINNKANITFRHLMSRCIINLKYNDAENMPLDPELTVYNLKTRCTINLRVGEVTPLNESLPVKPGINLVSTPGYDITYDVILIPQVIPSGTPLFTVNTGAEVIYYETEREITIKPQGLYTFNLTVAKSSIN